jgi:hypothetical protein
MSKKISSTLTAIAFAAALTLGGTAEAGPLFAGTAGTEGSAWSQAWEWLSGVWGDLTGLSSSTTSQSVKPDPATSTSDAGCGIDPNGWCGGG